MKNKKLTGELLIYSSKEVYSVIIVTYGTSPTIDAQKLCKLRGDVTLCFLVAANSDSPL